MSFKVARESITSDLAEIKAAGLWKTERYINSDQKSAITLSDGSEVINMCANNYLGLANNESINSEAIKSIQKYGYGMASVRFICGTHEIHKQLENTISNFLHKEDTILYSSCFDANTGLFETILNENDAVISDALNHASIIDGIRLCKAKRFRYENNNMNSLEEQLILAKDCETKLIVTDGVFSMDGIIANLKSICDLADKYQAMVMVDDSHAIGVLGLNGKGSIEYCDVIDRIDIVTGTLGKALGGASGGFTTGRKEIIDLLRQRSRPYIFSNTVAPSIVAASIKVFEILSSNTDLRDKLENNTIYFRSKMTSAGFDIKEGVHPIVPIMLYDAVLAQEMAAMLLAEGIYVIGFFFPVVPKGEARIRVQISAGMEKVEIDQAIKSFTKIGKKLKVI